MTAKLVKGTALNSEQVKQVKAAFIYRWTNENAQRVRSWLGVASPRTELVPDKDWISNHAFYIRKDGNLAIKPRHCEPAYMADDK